MKSRELKKFSRDELREIIQSAVKVYSNETPEGRELNRLREIERDTWRLNIKDRKLS